MVVRRAGLVAVLRVVTVVDARRAVQMQAFRAQAQVVLVPAVRAPLVPE